MAEKKAAKAATKKVTAKKEPAKKTASKVTKSDAKKNAVKKEPATKAATFNIEVEANAAMGVIVVEALKSEQFDVATQEVKDFFSKDEVSDMDVQSMLCKVFAQGVIAGAAIAADEAQKGFEDVNKLLQKLTKKK